MKGHMKILVLAALGLVALFVLGDALYIVSETEQVIVTQFGEPKGDAIVAPGVHVKVPFIQKTHVFEKRWLEWDGDPNQVPTRDKKYIWIDTYGRWRITDPLVFYQRVRDERGAQSRLDDIIDGESRNAIASYNLIEIVRSTNREFEATEEAVILDVIEPIEEIKLGRDQIARIIFEKASAITAEFGVEIKDVKVKRINYIDDVQRKVFERMIAERQRIASKYRSEGDGKSAEIRGQKERELKRITSEAYRKAQEIMGQADAEATAIYARAYNLDSEFYQFTKTLETYRATLAKQTWLVLSTDSEFFKYLKSAGR